MLWDELVTPWQACLEEAWAAYGAGTIPIGAVVVDATGQIVARGRNRIYDRTPAGRLLFGHRLAHAEVNALIAVDHERVDLPACAIYTTTEPCPLCVGAIRMLRLGAVHYASRDTAAGSIALLDATPFMRRRPIHVTGPERADLEALIVALHTAFNHEQGLPGVQWVLGAWETVTPAGCALGRALAASGELGRWRDAGAPAALVIDALAARLARL